jgi:hypothetical protein
MNDEPELPADPSRLLPFVREFRPSGANAEQLPRRRYNRHLEEAPVDNELKKRCYNRRIKSLEKIDMNNVTSLTVVLGDGTIWTAPASAFTQVTAPAEPFVPTEAQVQAAVDAGIIAAYTPVTTNA